MLSKTKQAGMTYIELIVVMGIFSVLTSVVIFSYGDFQAKVDIKNLASDVALQLVESKNTALSGLLPPPAQQPSNPLTWKPTYGVFFDKAQNKRFIYFTDLDSDTLYDHLGCAGNSECLKQIDITKNNIISSLDVVYQDNSTATLSDLTISFSRPSSSAIIRSTQIPNGSLISYVKITLATPKGMTGVIKVYSSGRIQIN